MSDVWGIPGKGRRTAFPNLHGVFRHTPFVLRTFLLTFHTFFVCRSHGNLSLACSFRSLVGLVFCYLYSFGVMGIRMA